MLGKLLPKAERLYQSGKQWLRTMLRASCTVSDVLTGG
jgi:hypothetical protein